MAQFLPKAVKEKTKMTIELDGEYTLAAYSTVVLKKGYTAIFKDIKAEEVTELSSIADGMYSGTAIDTRFEEKEALADVMILISNCPQLNNPCNAYNPTPVRLLIWD